MREMVIYGISFDMVGRQPIVLLKTVSGNDFLPIWTGHPEAAAILVKLQGGAVPRPATHDLFMQTIESLGAEVVRVGITELRDRTFFAEVVLRDGEGTETILDSRPSDALALAVRSDAPIYAEDEVIEEHSIEFQQEDTEDREAMVDEFRQFLDDVNPDDFLSGN